MINKKRKEYKIPDYNLPAPTLSSYSLFDSYYREEDKSIWLRGVGNKNTANVLFLGACPLEEDVDSDISFSDPRYLKSGPGLYFKRACLSAGINIDEEYYTTLCKYPLPRSYKLKPKITDITYCESILKEEFEQIKPKIIVCVGKEAADYILGVKAKLSELEESWMYSQQYQAMIYIMSDPKLAYYKPEYADKLRLELELLAKHYEFLCNGKSFIDVNLDYRKIETLKDLTDWINERKQANTFYYAVDTEFGNNSQYTTTFKDGILRSIQFCWEPGKAVFIHFHDANFNWVFDAPKEIVFKTLADYCNDPRVRFIGHNCAADAVWMKNHIGINIYDNKFIFDTMFAMQTVDEYSDLKLEKLAARYTTLGRYDIELILWKKKNKGIVFDEDEGYGRVPTDIIFPYGCRDVDATFRLWPIIVDMLQKDGTYDYYFKIKHPFVTEGFTSMSETGMPFDMSYADKQRIVYLAAGVIMRTLFKEMLEEEAEKLLREKLKTTFENKKVKLGSDNLDSLCSTIFSLDRNKLEDYDRGINVLKHAFKADFKHVLARYIHWFYISNFNIASPQQKATWLFDVKELTPIKTTKNPDIGNAIPWERVLLLSEAEQKNYKPATDKDTLKIFADAGDDLCLHLLQMNAINQITKNFLKGDEGGLQKYICSDGYVRPMFFCTESSRKFLTKLTKKDEIETLLKICSFRLKNLKQTTLIAGTV